MKYLTIWFILCVFIVGCEAKKTPPLSEDSITLPHEGVMEPETLFADTDTLWITLCDSIILDFLYIERHEPFKIEIKWR